MTSNHPESSVPNSVVSDSVAPESSIPDGVSGRLSQRNKKSPSSVGLLLRQLTAGLIALGTVSILWNAIPSKPRSSFELDGSNYPPLVKQSGDPYIRALMRTISASESNGPKPYTLLFGGEHFEDFNQHPDRCVPITVGVNQGDCTTAAGRYQFITTTWEEQAEKYHPDPSGLWFWQHYSFEPQYQDEVVYRWLSDSEAWGVDLSALLQQGQLSEVLQILSPVWTSLGYGIETNDMSDRLPQLYEAMLQEELSGTSS
ncbi:glycoside hydrolase family protein [Leptolyngbya sp. GB1-A1]|uniref:glycoside hydrolase family 24 protein n=1 Tax=Leptolyngbya sp. GB1-A1 TaxID=2933908 RepID=UPI0032992552